MSKRLVPLAVAFGLATISLGERLEPLISPRHALVYHWSGASSALFGPPVAALAVLTVLLFGLLISAQRPGLWRSLVWAAILVFLPFVILRQIWEIWPNLAPARPHLPSILWKLVASLVLGYLWNRYKPKQRDAVIETSSTILCFVALSGVLVVGQIGYFWWQAQGLNRPQAAHPEHRVAEVSSAAKSRIIWVVMDELSYQQLFEHRYDGLQLPAFDALKAESTIFTDVSPAANYTEEAVPSLLSGELVDKTRSTPGGMLEVHSAAEPGWRSFDGTETVFQDALSEGYRTRIVGWYIPYCRIFSSVVDECYWKDNYTESYGSTADGTFESNFLSTTDALVTNPSVRTFLQWSLHIPAQFRAPEVRDHLQGYLHLEDFRDLKSAADDALLDRSATFTLLHLPIPHPRGIYDRHTGRMTFGTSTYIDNLALSDRYLAHMRDVLEKSGQWDSSTIVVMGDHGWRTSFVWKTLPNWGAEAERASMGGKFDSRPAYIVKLAGQTTAARIDTPFDATRTRTLLDAAMSGKLRSPEDLEDWVEHRQPQSVELRSALGAASRPGAQN